MQWIWCKMEVYRSLLRMRWGVWAAVAGLLFLSACQTTDRQPRQDVQGGDAERGRRAIASYGCGSCHIIPGVREARGTVGPPLNGWANRHYIAGNLPNNPEDLMRWVMNPQEVEPGTAMPDMGVTDQDARDIAAYLYTLTRNP